MSSRRSMLGSALDSLPAPSDPLRELFEACKVGDVSRVKKLITPQTVNARDTAGRKSTPLHFAAGRKCINSTKIFSKKKLLHENNAKVKGCCFDNCIIVHGCWLHRMS